MGLIWLVSGHLYEEREIVRERKRERERERERKRENAFREILERMSASGRPSRSTFSNALNVHNPIHFGWSYCVYVFN